MPERLSAAEVRQLEFGESETLEFKASLNRHARREAMEGLCGMVNTDAAHGSVIFGVSPEGAIKGIEGNLDSSQRSLNQHIRDNFYPEIPEIVRNVEIVEHEGKPLIRVKAKRISSVPLHEYDGRVWIKEGTEKRHLTHEEQMHYRRVRDRDYHNGPWICSNCGMFADRIGGSVASDQGVQRTYECGRCLEGEFWPA
jgi:predicted HTH transcriptional regulator